MYSVGIAIFTICKLFKKACSNDNAALKLVIIFSVRPERLLCISVAVKSAIVLIKLLLATFL